MISGLRLLLLVVLLLWSTYLDISRYRIPNYLTVTCACIGFFFALFSGVETLKFSLLGFFAALAIGIIFWLLGVFRAGDAKLYAAVGMILGWQGVLSCFLYSMLVAGGMGLILLLLNGALLARCKRLLSYIKALFLTQQFIPYVPQPGTEHELPLAPAIALGALLAVCFPLANLL